MVIAMVEARWLVLGSALLIGLLGMAHLLLTFVGPRLLPRDRALPAHMAASALVLTGETNVWQAWIGFNASHSLGALLFAAIYTALAARHPQLLFADPVLLGVGATMLIALLWLAWRYWFRVPQVGIAMALALFLAGWAISAG